jgi:CBS domain containing-hemolysin-like protein
VVETPIFGISRVPSSITGSAPRESAGAATGTGATNGSVSGGVVGTGTAVVVGAIVVVVGAAVVVVGAIVVVVVVGAAVVVVAAIVVVVAGGVVISTFTAGAESTLLSPQPPRRTVAGRRIPSAKFWRESRDPMRSVSRGV